MHRAQRFSLLNVMSVWDNNVDEVCTKVAKNVNTKIFARGCGSPGVADEMEALSGAEISNLPYNDEAAFQKSSSKRSFSEVSDSLQSVFPNKCLKLGEKPQDVLDLRNSVLRFKRNKLEYYSCSYNCHIAELYFLNNNGNLVDFPTWCENPPLDFLKYGASNKLNGDNYFDNKLKSENSSLTFEIMNQGQDLKHSPATKSKHSSLNSTTPPEKSILLSPDASVVPDEQQTMQQDQMVEKAKQEAYVAQRIASLRKEGLWSEKRLPKVHEPSRHKTHWDYLLEEMVWLSADFAQEHKWKKALAKKCAKMVMKYHQEKALQAQRAEKEQELKLKKTAGFIAKEIRVFWKNVEKLIEYKVNARLDEKKKQALDQQLSFIVAQTEKYSSWLAESMIKPAGSGASVHSLTSSKSSTVSDDEFHPESCSDDDEETIAKEDDDIDEQKSELQLLQQESEQTLEDLLSELPSGYLEDRETVIHKAFKSEVCPNSLESSSVIKCGDKRIEKCVSVNGSSDGVSETVCRKRTHTSELFDNEESDGENMDVDFMADGTSSDDEATIALQEETEEKDYEKEINELQVESEIPIEELKRKYAKASHSSISNSNEVEGRSNNSDSEYSEYESDESMQSVLSDDESSGLKSLVNENLYTEKSEDCAKADKELEAASAVAETLQPRGFTLSSTSITTPVPVLLKHKLREYQHVGLDWLVTMHEKKLNGILADEMGLGKTIQTIALLAHLAYEKGIWGPHLIVVPTSVMLNWEMELKKWCPSFKILTYFGSQKERKLKRVGWTKPNAVQICITSYKLVIQDHQSFRRKKWKYVILDEAQNIKNFKSQRWQLLLNFHSQRRLLLTGTPLQNNLMELWSLMHFLMPNIFSSHREFREWFSNPVTGMIEGNKEYNDSIIKRLHKVLRPFILRRLKSEVEQQMPKKYEHVLMCRLSKRQRYLYEEFMSRTKTKETLVSGNFLSVINILMQLRKVCNHPNLFEVRPIISPFMMERILHEVPSCIWSIMEYSPFKAPQKLIEEIDSLPDPPPKCPAGKIKLHVRLSSQTVHRPATQPVRAEAPETSTTGNIRLAGPPLVPHGNVASGGIRYQLIQQGGSVKAIPLPLGSTGGMVLQQTPQGPRLVLSQQKNPSLPGHISPQVASGISAPNNALGGLQLVQTSSGQLLLTTAAIQKPSTSTPASVGLCGSAAAALLQRIGLKGLQGSVITTGAGGKPVLRLPSSVLRPHLQHPAVLSSGDSSASLPTTPPATPQTTPVNSPSKAISSTTNSTLTSSTSFSRPTTRTNTKDAEKIIEKKKDEDRKRSLFYLAGIEERKKQGRKDRLTFIANLNSRRCHACPIYGSDLIEAVSVSGTKCETLENCRFWTDCGYNNCLLASNYSPKTLCAQTLALSNLVRNPIRLLRDLKGITDRFVFYIPAAHAPAPVIRVHHPSPSKYWNEEREAVSYAKLLNEALIPLHNIYSATVTQFPDARLIQYDCGKLQTLDKLLRELKVGSHRVLIFTQMTKMLDIFEAFLNYHGHIYLRLDGSTRVDQRQILMERFNQDERIFAFILSTRSGGLGINLTGADTVIFYDSDWNPTMDAQAQDRCHRIGQTRDVHIYRLISEKTVEENILKKANQKRLLGDLAIEGGNFTTAFFKKQTIQDLFNIAANEHEASKRLSEVVKNSSDESKEPTEGEKLGIFENALAAAEDETDVNATRIAKAEAAAELAEFDESIPFEEAEGEELSKAEQEVANLMKQLTPVEKYAMNFLESFDDGILAEAERICAEIDQQKREWEMGQLQVLREEEERITQLSDDEMLTYSVLDARNQIWLPPTPPRDENDLYIDSSISFLYEENIMPEYSLPTIYVKKEHKRFRQDPTLPGLQLDSSNAFKKTQKYKREDSIMAPRSLFEHATSVQAKLHGDVRFQRARGIIRSTLPIPGLSPQQNLLTKTLESTALPEWIINEDWLIVKAIQEVMQLPTNLLVMNPGHTSNWDLVSDLVNSYSRYHRSARHCRNRYESVLLPREEGKSSVESSPRKISKKQKTGVFSKQQQTSSLMHTSEMYQQDNNQEATMLFTSRFEDIKSISITKAPTSKTMYVGTADKNPEHAKMFTELKIQYDSPLNPAQVAAKRAERVREEKQQQATLAQKQKLLQQQGQQIHISSGQLQQHNQQAVKSLQLQQQSLPQTSVQLQQGQQVSIVGTPCGLQQVVGSGTITGKLPTSVVLNQGTASPSISTAAATTVTTSVATLSGVRTAGVGTGSLGRTFTLQEFQLKTPMQTVVSVANLQALQAAKITPALTTQGSQPKGVTVATFPHRTITQQQIQLLRHNFALQQGKVIGDQTIRRVQLPTGTNPAQKVQVAVSGTSVPGVAAIQVSQPGRQIIKPGTVVTGSSGTAGVVVGTGKTVARTVTEPEITALLRRQSQQLAKANQVTQILANKRSLVNVKGAVGLQFSSKSTGTGGLSTVQIVPGGNQKQVTVQQLQQVFKQVQPQTIQQLTQGGTVNAVVGKAVTGAGASGIITSGTVGASTSIQAITSAGTTKLVPVTLSSQQQPIKQTIQVVSASSQGVTGAGSGTIRLAERSATSTLTLPVGAVKVSNANLISQVSAALQGQQVVRTTQSPVRIQALSSSNPQQNPSNQSN